MIKRTEFVASFVFIAVFVKTELLIISSIFGLIRLKNKRERKRDWQPLF